MVARNVNSVQRVQCSSTYYSSSGVHDPTMYSTTGVDQKIDQTSGLIRNAKSSSGWRSPSSYSRYISRSTPVPAGTIWSHVQGALWDPGSGTLYVNGYGMSAIGPLSLPSLPYNAESRAIVKALSQLKQQKVNLSVAFGERAEAAKMMASSVIKIAKTVKKFRNANPKEWAKVIVSKPMTLAQLEAKRASKAALGRSAHKAFHGVPDSWLEVQYGWKPLMSDVHGAITALNDKERDGDAYRATVRGTVSEKSEADLVIPYSDRYIEYRVKLKRSAGFKVRLDYVLENPLLATLSQLGITNPLELVWELVPYSFVVDWFIPVGGYLSSLDAALGWTFIGGSGTEWYSQSGHSPPYSMDIRGSVYGNPYICTGTGSGDYTEVQFKMNRKVYNSSPLPRFPGIKNPLSTGHLANALALLVSSFR